MSTNTGLIARLREGQTYDFNTGRLDDMSCPMDDAADAIEALEAEVKRLKGLYESSTAAHEETVGRAMRAEAQLAAAQGQERQPTYEQVCAWAEQCRDVNVLVHGPWLNPEKLCKLAAEWAAAPIPQQPEQVNAGYGELEAVMSAEFESHGFGAPESNKREYGRFRVGFASGWHSALTAAKQAQPVCGYDDETGNCTRVNCCKQAQPERKKPKCLTCKCWSIDKNGNCDYCGTPYTDVASIQKQAQPSQYGSPELQALILDKLQQAQPERAPLSDDEIQTIYLRTYNEGFHGRNLEIAFARAIEAAIKQGGQQ